jgi:hypothetical protein
MPITQVGLDEFREICDIVDTFEFFEHNELYLVYYVERWNRLDQAMDWKNCISN